MKTKNLFEDSIIEKTKNFLYTIFGSKAKKHTFYNSDANHLISSKDGLRCTVNGLRKLNHPLIELVISQQKYAEDHAGDATTTSALCYIEGLNEALSDAKKCDSSEEIKRIAFTESEKRDLEIYNSILSYKNDKYKEDITRDNLEKMINGILSSESHLLDESNIKNLIDYFFSKSAGIRIDPIKQSKYAKRVSIKAKNDFGIDVLVKTKLLDVIHYPTINLHNDSLTDFDVEYYSKIHASLVNGNHVNDLSKPVVFCRTLTQEALDLANKVGLTVLTLKNCTSVKTDLYFNSLKTILKLDLFSNEITKEERLIAMISSMDKSDIKIDKDRLENIKKEMNFEGTAKELVNSIRASRPQNKKATAMMETLLFNEDRVSFSIDEKGLSQIRANIRHEKSQCDSIEGQEEFDQVEAVFNSNNYVVEINSERFNDKGISAFDSLHDVVTSLKKLKESKINFLLNSRYIEDEESFSEAGIDKSLFKILKKIKSKASKISENTTLESPLSTFVALRACANAFQDALTMNNQTVIDNG